MPRSLIAVALRLSLSFAVHRRGKAMAITQQQKDEWRDALLREVVGFLGARKDEIHRNYCASSAGKVPLEELEDAGLLDVEVAITFLEDKRTGWGMGKGFLGMNLIQ